MSQDPTGYTIKDELIYLADDIDADNTDSPLDLTISLCGTSGFYYGIDIYEFTGAGGADEMSLGAPTSFKDNFVHFVLEQDSTTGLYNCIGCGDPNFGDPCFDDSYTYFSSTAGTNYLVIVASQDSSTKGPYDINYEDN